MSAGELKPCPTPWCAHSDAPYVWQGPDDRYAVICAVCQVEGPSGATEAEAIAAWNQRTDPTRDALLEALEPSGHTKAAYHGEFAFQMFRGVSDAGIDQHEKVYVPWTTVKEIMAAIKSRALAQAEAGK